ncbi:hypothetical protein VTJ49DRAFT_6816 [Mycothermus thermophilus]|uniref:LysM domain-containing protein n=1 Tax=Humicola insolens TaxID=85995 RepID=A0ABR3V1X7_HUMIN
MLISKLFGGLVLAATAYSRSIVRRACGFSVPAASGDTCASIAEFWGITEEDFIAWNPSVGPGCSLGVVPEQEYCIEWIEPTTSVTATPTTTSTTSSTTTITGPSPTQTGIIPTCTTFHKVVSGDTCQKIVDKYGTFTLSDFRWDGSAGNAPGPTQTGITPDCTTFYQVISGDTCQKIVDKHGTFTLDNFGRIRLFGAPGRRLRLRWSTRYPDNEANEYRPLTYADRADPFLQDFLPSRPG